jgi:nickel-dependent lactate racemase
MAIIIPKRNIKNFHRMIEYNNLVANGLENTKQAKKLYKTIQEQSEIIRLLNNNNIR